MIVTHANEVLSTRTRLFVLGMGVLCATVIAGCIRYEPEPIEAGGLVFDVLPAHQSESGLVTANELRVTEEWTTRLLTGGSADSEWLEGWLGTATPFSFRFGEESSATLLGEWQLAQGEPQVGSDRVFQELVWSDPATGLRVIWEVTRFVDFPVLEWVLKFENAGSENTAILEDIQALDLRLHSSQAGQPFVVHGALGGRSQPDDMAPFSQALLPYGSGATRKMELGAVGPGIRERSESSNSHLPFFNVETPDSRGLVVGVGWSGTWRAQLSVTQNECHVLSGLRETHFVLKPGETVRTPRILVALWEGKRLHGQNVFRRLLYERYVPHLRGKLQEPLVSVNVCFTYKGFGAYLHKATEEKVLALVDPFIQLGAELFIIDAGWFEGAPWHQWLGNWVFARDKYPGGFTPISRRLAEAGVEFGLWFAPELATSQAPVVSRHPDLLRRRDGTNRYTVRMELPESREWFLRQMDQLVKEEGLTCYRQDLSGTFGDEPGHRKGISESHHVAGLYQLWDTLKERHPDMIMEGCCAGGRRIDLETAARFHWHQKSDRWFDSESDQLGLYGASLFLPGGILNIPTQATDDYGAWSGFAGQFSLGWDPLDEAFPMEQARQQVELYKEIRPLLSGDFYPLTPPSLDQPWMGYQFHRRDLDRRVALIFRRGIVEPLTPVRKSLTVSLRGLEPDAEYRVRFRRAGSDEIKKGREFTEATVIVIPEAPGAEMLAYERVD